MYTVYVLCEGSVLFLKRNQSSPEDIREPMEILGNRQYSVKKIHVTIFSRM